MQVAISDILMPCIFYLCLYAYESRLKQDYHVYNHLDVVGTVLQIQRFGKFIILKKNRVDFLILHMNTKQYITFIRTYIDLYAYTLSVRICTFIIVRFV